MGGSPRGRAQPLDPRRHTLYNKCMTMLSFRTDVGQAADAGTWAERLGIDRSELLRDALRRHLVLLAAEADAGAWSAFPLTLEEASLGEIANWGVAEDWSDWADAEG